MYIIIFAATKIVNNKQNMTESMTNLRNKRKYTIYTKLNKLTNDDYRIAKNKLPLALNISKRTFDRWMYVYIDEKLEAPADKLAVIAKFLGCKFEEMFNYDIPQYNTSKLKRLTQNNLATDLNLIK